MSHNVQKLNPEELKKMMGAKIKAIPTPKIPTRTNKQKFMKNRDKDGENFKHTMKILEERQNEAVEDGDSKKMFAAVAVAADQRDQFHNRNQLTEIQTKFNFIKKSISEDEWAVLEPLVSFKDEMSIQGAFSEQDLHKMFRDEFNVKTKNIVKLLQLSKLQSQINEMKSVY